MKKSSYIFCFALLFFCSLVGRAQNYAVSLNGTSDYVDCGSSAAMAATNIKGMECWVMFRNLTANQEILSKSATSSGIELLVFNNALSFYCMKDPSNASFITYPTSNLSTNVWYHVAVTWDGTNSSSMKLFVNDVSVGTRTDVGSLSAGISNPSGSFKIGQWSDAPSRAFNGVIDEVRVWNTVLTASQVKSGMYGTVAKNSSGLLAYYTLNEGSGSTAANSSTSTVAAAGSNGTLMNTAGWASSPVQWGDNALYFDGTNNYVTAPSSASYDFTTGTVECRVNPQKFNGNSTIVATRNSSTGRYSFQMSATQIGLWNGTSWSPVNYNFSIGQWYSLAFVCTGTSTTIYVNGTSIGSTANVVGTATGLPLMIGMSYPGATVEQFTGAIDEVRIWNSALSQAQIQANLNSSLTGTETGLVALFGFNQGIGGGNNQGLITAIDGTAANNHATLTNFSMSGATSNWISRTATLPVVLLDFSASRNSKNIHVQWSTASEYDASYFEVEKSNDGKSFSGLGRIKAAGYAQQQNRYGIDDDQPFAGRNYYRLKQVDIDGKATYSAVVMVNWNKAASLTLQLTPQPLHQEMTMSIENADFKNGRFMICDAGGKTVGMYPIKTSSGNARIRISRNGLVAGMYFYKLVNSEGQIKASGQMVVD